MTTLIYAQLALDTGWLRFACAGHPPPLIIAPGEPPEFVWVGRSVPINAYDAAIERPQSSCRLGAGALVVLYTDGLIERRSPR